MGLADGKLPPQLPPRRVCPFLFWLTSIFLTAEETMFEKISAVFLSQAAAVLANTNSGMSGSNIVKAFTEYALDFDKNIPYATYPNDAPNKRTAFLENLQAFEPKQQYQSWSYATTGHSEFRSATSEKR
jgi:hypothetical protein